MASGLITSWEVLLTVETVSDFILGGSQITADGDCSQEIKRHLLLGRKVMTNLDSIFKSRDITLPTKVRLVKAMVFLVVMYGCESWTVQKAAVAAAKSLQLCPTLCDPMNHRTPGFLVHHQLPEFTQTHAHQVSDAIQPSHPLSSPSPAFSLSQDQGLFKLVISSHQVAKVLEFQLQHQSFQRTPRTDLLQNGLVGSPCSPRDP